MKFSKKEAAQRIGISTRTLDRAIKAGKITVERVEAGLFEQSVTISLEALGSYLGISDATQIRARLGLPCLAESAKDAPEQSGAQSAPDTEPACDGHIRPELPPLAQRTIDDLEFAERYLRGEVPDSAGNYHDGRNARWSETTSLVGPGIPPAPPPDCNEHVSAALRSDTGWNGVSADSTEHPLNTGFKGLEVKRPAHPNTKRMAGLRGALLVRYI